MSAIGFDIGNENSFIAAVISGGIEVLDNEYCLRATPTYVAFTEASRDIGIAAKAKVVSNLENTIFGFKKILGKMTFDQEVKEELRLSPHRIAPLPNNFIGFEVSYLNEALKFSTTQLMSMVLTKLKSIAENKTGNRISDCAIAVPVYYTDTQRRAMLDAAKIAGLNPLRLISESAAVALTYGFYRSDLSDDYPLNVVFIDIGHSLITVTACAFTKERLRVLGTVWEHVGGRDFDSVLVEHFAEEFEKKYKIDVLGRPKALMALTLECESLKRQMSANSLELVLSIECFVDDVDVTGRMRRSVFEKLSSPLLARIENTVRAVLTAAELTSGDVHAVELVGGSTRIPAVKQLISRVYEREPKCTLNQDEAVARGCALQCALLSPALKVRQFILEDSPTYDIKVTWKNQEKAEEELIVFRGYHRVPVHTEITFPVSQDFNVDAYQVNRSAPREVKIGAYAIVNFPETAPNSYSEVKALACVDIHGLFSITGAKLMVRSARCNTLALIALPGGKEDELMNKDDAGSQPPSSKVESFPLTVIPWVLSLLEKDLNEYIEIEKQMNERYLAEKEKADARNALEEQIYDLRSKINDEFKEFVQDRDKNWLLEYLNEQESWMFDNKAPNVREYSRKAKESEELFKPIFRRYKEWEERPKVVEEFQEALQNALDQIEEITSEKVCLPCEDVRKLKEIYNNAKYLYSKSVKSFANLKKCEDTSVTTEYLRSCLSEFQSDFEKKYAELESKARPDCESTEQCGDSSREENGGGSSRENTTR